MCYFIFCHYFFSFISFFFNCFIVFFYFCLEVFGPFDSFRSAFLVSVCRSILPFCLAFIWGIMM